MAQQAVSTVGRVNRAVVAEAIRGQGYALSNARLTEVMTHVRGKADPPQEDAHDTHP